MRSIPLYAMERIIKDIEDIRVSEGAKIALKKELEKIAKDISKKAIELSKHAKRKTVLASDIELAFED